MTENEAIARMKYRIETATDIAGKGVDGKVYEDMEIAIKALEEIQQYKAIGTADECREARERQIPKIPYIWGDGCDEGGNMIYDKYDCPNCNKSYEIDYHDYKYCPNCGQAINRDNLADWFD